MLQNLKKHIWGFTDVCFTIINATVLMITGNKYDICNKNIPNFLPFVKQLTGNFNIFDTKAISNDTLLEKYYSEINHSAENKMTGNHKELQDMLKTNNIKYSFDGYDILSHSHGQLSVDEIYRIKYGDFKKLDTVDIVIYPKCSKEIEMIFNISKKNNYKIIPYGGGTNVTGCLLINRDELKQQNKDVCISLDMRYFNNILHTDIENNYAIIQSGACGKEIEDHLNSIGYTMGHEPDSYEFSTLGGWISTYASGMRRNKYGNIEEIVVDFGYINDKSRHIIDKDKDDKKSAGVYIVRHSHGPKPQNLFFGHEGNFGIITDVVVNIKKIPSVKLYESIVFHSMADGIKFLREINSMEYKPSSIRLVDNQQFKFGQALKPEKTNWFDKLIDKIKKFYLFKVLKYDLDKIVASTLLVEGTRSYCESTIKEIKKIVYKYNGILGGSENGKSGYNLTHAIAYIRDFMNEYNVLSETFETSIEWDKIEDMAESVKTVLITEYKKYMKHTPLFSYRISQCYNTGVCVYFTLGFNKDESTTPEESIEIYHTLEKLMREVMIMKGGSISHHHGIGKIKAKELGDDQLQTMKSIKDMYDSNNIFCENNYLHCIE